MTSYTPMTRLFIIVTAALSLLGCPDDKVASVTGADTTGNDSTSDGGGDTPAGVDVGPDAVVDDTTPDGSPPEVVSDTPTGSDATPDGTPDVTLDAPSDGTGDTTSDAVADGIVADGVVGDGTSLDSVSDAVPDTIKDVVADVKQDTFPDVKPDLQFDVGFDAIKDVKFDAIKDVKFDTIKDVKADTKLDIGFDTSKDVKLDIKLDVAKDIKLDAPGDIGSAQCVPKAAEFWLDDATWSANAACGDITATVTGSLPSSTYFIASSTSTVLGNSVVIDVFAKNAGGIGLPVISPFTHDEVLAGLPDGDYCVRVNFHLDIVLTDSLVTEWTVDNCP